MFDWVRNMPIFNDLVSLSIDIAVIYTRLAFPLAKMEVINDPLCQKMDTPFLKVLQQFLLRAVLKYYFWCRKRFDTFKELSIS